MVFFTSEYAALLQYITLPLELFGLGLATIEVRFPSTANKMNLIIADYFDHVRSDDEEMRQAHPRIHKLLYFGPSFPAPKWPTITLFCLLLYLGLAVTFLFGSLGLKSLGVITPLSHAVNVAIYNDFISLVVGPIGGVVLLFFGLLFITATFVENRAVGTLGIIIAGLGVVGEIYQVITQLASS